MTHGRLALPQVTLCAVTSVNVGATVQALWMTLDQIDFASCKLLTDAEIDPDYPEITIVPTKRIDSSASYSQFLLSELVNHIETPHCLVVQWDGHVIDAGRWRPEFLDYDYIGARWPQFSDDHVVGNGGFSLRSRRLLETCQGSGFRSFHPEDIAICRENRRWLEDRGIRFAPPALADVFACERTGDPGASFGYHGVWNMPRVLGVNTFWQIYRDLDDRGTIRHDFYTILKDVSRGRGGFFRMVRMIFDHLNGKMRKIAGFG